MTAPRHSPPPPAPPRRCATSTRRPARSPRRSTSPPPSPATTAYAPRQPYIYAREGGPTVAHAEAVLADLDGAAASLAFASGMSAFVALTETLPQRRPRRLPRHHVPRRPHLAPPPRGTPRHRPQPTSTPPTPPRSRKPSAPATRLVWIEVPTNPTWDVIDIAAAAAAAHAAGALLAADCTAAPPCTLRALELGADIAFHSGTKYLGGHSDLTAGVLSFARRDDLFSEINALRTLMGGVIKAFEAWLLIRGIRTLFLRYERASASALAIARHFEHHPAVERVLYPGLPAHPGHAVAARQMTGGFGGMLSLLVRGGFDTARDVARFAAGLPPRHLARRRREPDRAPQVGRGPRTPWSPTTSSASPSASRTPPT